MEVTTHTVTSKEQKVSILLEGLQKTDGYGTNLELTGQGNWFGSLNMCNMLADNSHDLFASIGDDYYNHQSSSFSLLELGSGLGRAGLMAVKLIDLESKRNDDAQHRRNEANKATPSTNSKVLSPSWSCVLSDGEDEVMELLNSNYRRNFSTIQTSAEHRAEYPNASSSETKCDCQQLWWGENAELSALQASHPAGFDLIIGADLIYGRDEVVISETVDPEDALVETSGESKAADGFCRDKLHALLYTVNALLSRRGSSSTSANAACVLNGGGEKLLTEENLKGSRTLYPASASASVSSVGESGSPSGAVGDFDVRRRPGFYLAITRRELLPLEELRAVALESGLCVSLLEDYTFDIFDTNVDSESMFWRDTILLFTRL